MRGRAPARREETQVLARACLIAASVLVATVLVPFSATAPRGLGALLAGVALTLGAALHLRAPAVQTWQLHAVLSLATALVTLSVAASTTPSGTLVTAVSYVWLAIYSATFHARRVLVRHLAGISAGLAVGLWHAGAPSGVQMWGYLTATFVGVALVLNGRVRDLRSEATTDPLTGALSRRAFRRAAELEMIRAARTGQPLTLVVVDLDDFKNINDLHGHAAGDAVLAGLVREWAGELRPTDVVGRFGGDEFTLLLPGSDADDAATVLRRLRSPLCGWSAGVATWRSGGDFDAWFAAADADLYAAKSAA